MKDLAAITAQEQSLRGELKAVREKLGASRAQIAKDEARETEVLAELRMLRGAAMDVFDRAERAGLPAEPTVAILDEPQAVCTTSSFTGPSIFTTASAASDQLQTLHDAEAVQF